MSRLFRERRDYIVAGVKTFANLERRATSAVGWIAFKLGITETKAAGLLRELAAEETGDSPPCCGHHHSFHDKDGLCVLPCPCRGGPAIVEAK